MGDPTNVVMAYPSLLPPVPRMTGVIGSFLNSNTPPPDTPPGTSEDGSESGEQQTPNVVPALTKAIGTYEWRGNNSPSTYRRVNKINAIGRYQVMPDTLRSNARRFLGMDVSPEDFRNSPELQDQFAQGLIGEYYNANLEKYGDPTEAARWTAIDWYGHNGGHYDKPAMHKGKVVGESPNQYAGNVLGYLQKFAGQDGQQDGQQGQPTQPQSPPPQQDGGVSLIAKYAGAQVANTYRDALLKIGVVQPTAPITPQGISSAPAISVATSNPESQTASPVQSGNSGLPTTESQRLSDFEAQDSKPKPGDFLRSVAAISSHTDTTPSQFSDEGSNPAPIDIDQSKLPLVSPNLNPQIGMSGMPVATPTLRQRTPEEVSQYEANKKAKEAAQNTAMLSLAASDMLSPATAATGATEYVAGQSEVGKVLLTTAQQGTNLFGIPQAVAPEEFAKRAAIYEPETAAGKFVAGQLGGLAKFGAEMAATGGAASLIAKPLSAAATMSAVSVLSQVAPMVSGQESVKEGVQNAAAGVVMANLFGPVGKYMGEQAAASLPEGAGVGTAWINKGIHQALGALGVGATASIAGDVVTGQVPNINKAVQSGVDLAALGLLAGGEHGSEEAAAPSTEAQPVEAQAAEAQPAEPGHQDIRTSRLEDTPHEPYQSGKYVTDAPLVEHTTSSGKTLKGVIAPDLTAEQAKAISPYAAKVDGGYFIAEEHVSRPEGFQENAVSNQPVEEPANAIEGGIASDNNPGELQPVDDGVGENGVDRQSEAEQSGPRSEDSPSDRGSESGIEEAARTEGQGVQSEAGAPVERALEDQPTIGESQNAIGQIGEQSIGVEEHQDGSSSGQTEGSSGSDRAVNAGPSEGEGQREQAEPVAEEGEVAGASEATPSEANASPIVEGEKVTPSADEELSTATETANESVTGTPGGIGADGTPLPGAGAGYLGSGLGGLQPVVEQIGKIAAESAKVTYEKDIKPAIDEAKVGMKDLQSQLAVGTLSEAAGTMKAYLRKFRGGEDQKLAQVLRSDEWKRAQKSLRSLSPEDRERLQIDLINGKEIPTDIPASAQKAAQHLRDILHTAGLDINNVGDLTKDVYGNTKPLLQMRDNYFTGAYKKKSVLPDWMTPRRANGNSQFGGPQKMFIPRVGLPAEEILQNGMELRNPNITDTASDYLQSKGKFVTAKMAVASLARAGHAINYIGEEVPRSDLEPIKGAVGKTLQQVDGVDVAGRLYTTKEVARVINNFTDIGTTSPFTRWLLRSKRKLTNTLNQVQLAGFAHAGISTPIKIGANIASGLAKAFNSTVSLAEKGLLGVRDPETGKIVRKFSGEDMKNAIKGLAEIPGAPFTAGSDFTFGLKLMDAYHHPEKYSDEMNKLVKDNIVDVGGRILASPELTEHYADRLLQDLSDHNLMALPHAIGATFEAISKPTMEYLIPSMKTSAAVRMGMEWDRVHPNATPIERLRAHQANWDDIDNRHGQVVYDNWMIPKNVKDVMFTFFGRPGWAQGTIASIGKGVRDIPKIAGVNIDHPLRDGVKFQRPEMTDRAAFAAFGLHAAVAGTNIAIQYMLTGKFPWQTDTMLSDMLLGARTGKTLPDGSPERLSVINYDRDLLSWFKDPAGTLTGKLAPDITTLATIATNTQYNREQVHDVDYTKPMNGLLDLNARAQDLEYAAKSFVPYGVQNMFRLAGNGDVTLDKVISAASKDPLRMLLPNIGITPLSRRLTASPAQEIQTKINEANAKVGGNTVASVEKMNARHDIENSLDKQDTAAAHLKEADYLQQGRLSQATIDKIEKDHQRVAEKGPRNPVGFPAFAQDNMDQKLTVLSAATPTERERLLPFVAKSLAGQAEANMTEEEQQRHRSRFRAITGFDPQAMIDTLGTGGKQYIYPR